MCRNESSSRDIMRLSDVVRRSISSPVLTAGSRSPKLREVIVSAVRVISSSGRSARFITRMPPRIAAARMSGMPRAKVRTSPCRTDLTSREEAPTSIRNEFPSGVTKGTASMSTAWFPAPDSTMENGCDSQFRTIRIFDGRKVWLMGAGDW